MCHLRQLAFIEESYEWIVLISEMHLIKIRFCFENKCITDLNISVNMHFKNVFDSSMIPFSAYRLWIVWYFVTVTIFCILASIYELNLCLSF